MRRPAESALVAYVDRRLGSKPAMSAWKDAARSPATVVIATRNRRERLLATLARLCSLPERPPVVVVDTGSIDGTAVAVRRAFPGVEVIEAADGIGSAARNVGVKAADTPLVAFSDDDSWWAPGSLGLAADLFEAFPALGLIAARIVVEPRGALDPTCEAMRESPLHAHLALPGPPILGFVACAAVARRSVILGCGGFHARYGFGGEEHLLAVDMASTGWGLAYVHDVVAHHEPAAGGRDSRVAVELRNRLWSTWLRRPLRRAVRLSLEMTAGREGGMRALLEALRGLPWVARERRVVPPHVEDWLRLLEAGPRASRPEAGHRASRTEAGHRASRPRSADITEGDRPSPPTAVR